MAGNSSTGDSRKLYQNWIKGGLGLKIVKEGISPYVREEVQNQHRDFLKGLPSVGCTSCALQDLKPDHSCIKTKSSKTCPLGMKKCLCLRNNLRPCPNSLCGKLYDKIVQSHRFQDPNWSNTDIGKWSTDFWEIAKCYINTPGYGDKSSAEETDCSGLLSMLINNFVFPFPISTSPPLDDFSRMRNTRNEIMHAPNLEISDADLQKYLTDMETLLGRIKHPVAKSAADNIKTLQTSVIISAEDEKSLRLETLKELEREKVIALQCIEKKKEDVTDLRDKLLHDLQLECSSATDDIKKKGEENLHTLQTKKDQILNEFETEKSKDITAIESARDKALEKITGAASAIREKTEKYMERLKESEDETKSRLNSIENSLKDEQKNIKILYDRTDAVEQEQKDIKSTTGMLATEIDSLKKTVDEIDQTINKHKERLAILKVKEDMRNELAEYYAQNYFHVCVTPVIKRPIGNIDDMFFELTETEPPFLEELLQKKLRTHHRYCTIFHTDSQLKEQHAIGENSYKSVFTRKNNLYQNIVVTGDRHSGTTTWCWNLLHKWVTAKAKEVKSGSTRYSTDVNGRESDETSEGENKVSEDELFLKMFDIVLYIPLANHSKHETLPELIRNSPESPFYQNEDKLSKLEEILRSKENKCLIVLDDLQPLYVDEPIRNPDKQGMDNCFFVSTSFANAHCPPNFEIDEFDRFISIKCIGNIYKLHANFASKFLKHQVMNGRNEISNEGQIEKVLIDTSYLANIEFTSFVGGGLPVFIVFLILNWIERGNIERTRALNYAATTDYIIHLAANEMTGTLCKIKNYDSYKHLWTDPMARLPDCFDQYSKLKEYAGLILKLAKNVFQHIFALGEKDLTQDESALLYKMGLLIKSGNENKLQGHDCSFDVFLSALYLVVYTNANDDKLIHALEAHCETYDKMRTMEAVLIFASGIDPKIVSILSFRLYPCVKHGEEIDRLFKNPFEKCKEEMSCFSESYPSSEHPIFTTKICLSDAQTCATWECNYERVTEVHLNSTEIQDHVLACLRKSRNVKAINWFIPTANMETYQLEWVTDVLSSFSALTVLTLSGCGSTWTPNCIKTQDIDLLGCRYIQHISLEVMSCRNIYVNSNSLVSIFISDICKCAVKIQSLNVCTEQEESQIIYKRVHESDIQDNFTMPAQTVDNDEKTLSVVGSEKDKQLADSIKEVSNINTSVHCDKTQTLKLAETKNEDNEKCPLKSQLFKKKESKTENNEQMVMNPTNLGHIFCKYMKDCKLEFVHGPKQFQSVILTECHRSDIVIKFQDQERISTIPEEATVCFNKTIKISECSFTRLIYYFEQNLPNADTELEVVIDSLEYGRNQRSGLFSNTRLNAIEVTLCHLLDDAEVEMTFPSNVSDEMKTPEIDLSVDIVEIPKLNSVTLLTLLGQMPKLKRLTCKNISSRLWGVIGTVLPKIQELELLSVENQTDIPASFIESIKYLKKLTTFVIGGNCQGTSNENRISNKRRAGIKELAKSLPSLQNVEHIDISNLEIWPKLSLSYLSKAAPEVNSVKCHLKSEYDIEMMCGVVRSLPRLRSLHLECDTGEDVEELLLALEQLKELRHLSCSGISFDESFPENTSTIDLSGIQSFRIDCTKSWNDDVPCIINYLPCMSHLTNLSIQAFLSEMSWALLASSLPHLDSLQIVELSSLPRHVIPAAVLESLSLVRSLRKLILNFQLMSQEELNHAISKLYQLDTLELVYQTLYCYADLSGLLKALSKLVNLRELSVIAHRYKNPKKHTELAAVLPNLKNLEKLALGHMVRTPSVLLSLQHLPNLQYLTLPGFRAAEWLSFGQSLPYLKRLKSLQTSLKGTLAPAPKYWRKYAETGALALYGTDDELL
ncbi:uncharacterized protein LOC123527746 [Mercenaria mercenaria]|uniref:uncharacterized protein LOC123527746 n=1 Tax=Mercenaria mercenaria TaxID=6596 RepID=UPI00234F8C85|nr:uncharacterized protein LOC123527746 [Mercenaria mercenaria]